MSEDHGSEVAGDTPDLAQFEVDIVGFGMRIGQSH